MKLIALYMALISVLLHLKADMVSKRHSIAGGTTSLATTTVQCTSAFEGTKYNTPDGLLDDGYYTVLPQASSTVPKLATTIGIGAWERCKDQNGYTHTVEISTSTYATIPSMGIPSAQVMATTTP